MASPPAAVQPTAATPPQAEYPTEKTVYIATNSIGAGFNPHIGADQSPITTAIGAMTLPSAFDPSLGPDGTVVWTRSAALLTSAEVTSNKPFTVTYRIHNDAQWSDGLPITGDDFAYLWQQMSRQPNAVAPAGYRLIDDVQTSGGGKTVAVSFAQAYPAWRELFRSLLPSHVLKGAPAGFQTGMDTGKPVSGGPFAIVGIDQSRDEVRLARNDRYWVTPPKLDQIVLRRAGTAPQMVESVRSGDSAITALSTGPATTSQLETVPGLTSQRDLTSRALTLNVNTRSPAMRSEALRTALLGMIDGGLVTLASAGDDIVTQYSNTVYAPSDPNYAPTSRSRPTAAAVAQLMTAAGYVRGEPAAQAPVSPDPTSGAPSPTSSPTSTSAPTTSETSTPSTASPTTSDTTSDTTTPSDEDLSTVPDVPTGVAPWVLDGKPLVVRVGAVASDPRSTSAAASIVDQLRRAGVRAKVVPLSNSELYGVALTNSRVEVVVGWTGLGVPPATSLASQVDCDQPKARTAPSLSTPPTPTSVAPGQVNEDSSSTANFASNVSGLCDATLIDLARRALSSDDPTPLLAQAETLLAQKAVYLPFYQDAMLTGVTPAVFGVPLTGPVQVGIFGDSVRWGLSK
ncbi:ABC transporter family substrate-binding protein [Gordonia sp. TBRC 11910]|uniref:ABC transporter family substrate-binding protein n=1 Tax=Gordonia asplenii TaxID=2725283 RepID=A0A848L0P4_9ACTN|nr:ABC transporter family substrate-binding protein [Gordonia asplenii]NMO02061.1 ABC transporter family substrate-binding protein [Gordonia asplenii]